MKIRFLSHDHKIEGVAIILLGILVSVWSDTISVVASIQDVHGLNYPGTLIVQTFQFTHFIIVATTVAGYYWAIKKNDPAFLKPWLITKMCEGILLFIATILLGTGWRFTWLISISLIALILGTYVFLGVWNLFKKMSLKEVQTSNSIPEPPPSYDSFANQQSQSA